MNWINNLMRPKIRSFLTTKREVPDNLWRTCPLTGQMVFHKDLEANQFVFPGSDYHERMSANARLEHLFDGGEFSQVAVPDVPVDPLKFRDSKRYTDRLKEARTKTDLTDAVLVGEGSVDGRTVVAAVQDFDFMAGSLGMAAGEALISGMLQAVQKKSPFVLFAASGGARMQEGILSLMQMPRTTIAVQRLRDARLPYIVVLTNPTSGGVTASYAMLGDVHIAEPGALICFAGPRVIQQTIRENLPDGFQRSEYLLEHGMVDMVVHRHQLRETISRLCQHLMAGRDRLAEREAEESAANGTSGKSAAAKANGKDAGASGEASVRGNGSQPVPGTGKTASKAAKASTAKTLTESASSDGEKTLPDSSADPAERQANGKPSDPTSGKKGGPARGSKGAA